jgi:branched-chain amino acid transport system ATP-binding protein
MLEVSNLSAWYRHSHILQGVTLEVKKGEIVTLIGRNGAGKTTTLKTIMGLVTKHGGSVRFDGEELLSQPARARYHLGLAYVPEERRIVPGLTVEENLRLGILASASRAKEAQMIEKIADTFPRLKQRLSQQGTTLSGARAMMAEPRMILLDEPSEGIMPILVEEMFAQFRSMKDNGITILLVEQNVELALSLSDRVYVMDQGVIVHSANAAVMLADPEVQEKYCSV